MKGMQGRPPDPAGRGSRPVLDIVGREVELSVLAQLLDETRAGSSRAAIIEGEPGIGKSRLAEEVSRRAASKGFTIFHGTGEEFQTERPFGVISMALGVRTTSTDNARIAELLREAPATFGADHRYRIIEAMEDALEHEALTHPVLLLIDDAQWADSSSLLALHVMSRRDDLPVLVLVACRPVPRSEELKRLLGDITESGGHGLRLPPLDDEAVGALAKSRLGADLGTTLRDQLARTAGNPLFVLELLDGLEEEQMIKFEGGAAEASGLVEPPPSLQAVIIRRLGFLSEKTIELLRTAAVLGDSFSATDLALVVGMPIADVLTTLKEPIAAGFVTAMGDTLAFRHDLVREALYSDVAPAIRKGLHLHIGRTLAAAGAPPIRVAHHVALGAESGDREAVGWLRDAALDIAPRAPELAVELLDRAASLLPNDDLERIGLLLEAVTRLIFAGKLERAERVAEELAPQVAGTPAEIMLEIQRSGILGLQFRIEEMGIRAELLLEGEALPEDFHMQIVSISAGARLARGDLPGALSRMEEARAFTEANPASVASGLRLWMTANLCLCRGLFSESVEMLAQAVPGTEMFVGGRGQGLAVLGMGYCVGADRFEESRATLELARADLERRGALSFLVEYQWFLAHLHFITGSWDDSLAELAASKELAVGTGAVGIAIGWIADPTILIQLFRGDAAAAEQALAMTDRQSGAWWLSHWIEPIRALLQEASGDRTGAVTTLRSWQLATTENSFVPDLRTIGRSLVEICRTAGAEDVLQQMLADATEAHERADGVKSVEGAALLVQGAIGDDLELLLAAVEASRAAGRPFDLAEACAEAGLSLLRRQESELGRPLVMEAFSLYEALGASRREAELAQDVRDFGIRRGARQRRGKPDRGWESLTESELKVVGLVAEGLTNREIGARLFISKGTVATHLHSVFRKLDVSSRAELAAEAVRHMG